MNTPRVKLSTLASISCLSFLVSLYLAEAFLWVADPRRSLPPNGMHNGMLYTWGHVVNENRFGFREHEFVTPKPPHTFRIMVLGDSLTWGAGLAEEQRYSNLLQGALQKKFADVQKIEVLNFGFQGGPTVAERAVLTRFIDVVKPDLIVVGFCLNDPQPRGQDWSVERERMQETRLYKWFVTSTYLMRLVYLNTLAEKLNSAFLKIAEVANLIPHWHVGLGRTYAADSQEWRDFDMALKDIKRLAQERSLPAPVFAVLNQALESRFAGDYSRFDDHLYLRWYQQAKDAAINAGFSALDFKDELKEGNPAMNMVINELDSHPSPELNVLYAEKLSRVIAPVIRRSLLLDPPSGSHVLANAPLS